jgi:MFS transporter, PPP family, 3-phenylpropionic acid transporter
LPQTLKYAREGTTQLKKRRSQLIDRRLLAPKLFYFFWFGAGGALLPFIGIYYRDTGLDLAQIGLLAAITGFLQIAASPIWGMLADALNLRRMLLPLTVAGTLPPVYLISRGGDFELFVILVVVQAIFSAPIVALSDSATLALLGDQRERYGAQRIWGAVGWGVSTLFFGTLVEQQGLGIVFAGYLVMAALAAASAAALPRSTLPAADLRSATGKLLRDSRWAGFLLCILLISCCGAIIHSFISLYLQDIGASGQQIGFAHALASISEIPVMALSPWLLRRWGSRAMLASAGFLYVVRTSIYVIAPSPGWALAAQGLHGLCFSTMWTAGVLEAQRLAPRGLETTAQSLFSTTVFGVASVVATATGGRVYRDFGHSALFAIAGATALIGALGLLAGARTLRAQRLAQSEKV